MDDDSDNNNDKQIYGVRYGEGGELWVRVLKTHECSLCFQIYEVLY